MNPENDPRHDELRDRLLEQALAEVLAGAGPPDLTDKILAAAEQPESIPVQQKERVMKKRSRWLKIALPASAACLVLGVMVCLLLPATQSAREAARRASMRSKSERIHGLYDGYPSTGLSFEPRTAEPIRVDYDFDIDEDITRPFVVFGNEYGRGPGRGGDKYDMVVENPFRAVKDHPLSTFSIDVDTASYANVRRFLLGEGRLPPPDAVRIEEMINYFDYDYAGPTDATPLAAHLAVAGCPWRPEHRLVRVALKGKVFPQKERPASNLVFLLDVSGSMDMPDKLPLLKAGMKLLARQMRENDRVAIVVYAGAEGLVLPSTSGANREEILEKLGSLQAGGSTNGGAGIELAYRIAQENFITDGVNRVILCTDGDFNVGTTSTAELTRMVEDRARSGVFLSVLGFGRGNLNDAMMETLSNKGNGNYAYIDTINEARKVLVRQMGATLVTIAKDVKIQVEFNPARVAAYRLIGYENRMLAKEDFNDDKKDAGEIGAGHTVTALYEVVPVGATVETPSVDPLKYQPAAAPGETQESPSPAADASPATDELLTVKLRYKEPNADVSKRLEFPLVDRGASFGQANHDFQFAASVAAAGMLLRNSRYKGTATYDAVLEMATAAKGADPHGYRAEFLKMVHRAKDLAGRSEKSEE